MTLTRRDLLADGAGALAAMTVVGRMAGRTPLTARAAGLGSPTSTQAQALRALGRRTMRMPDSLPNPRASVGAESLAGIDHIVVLMMENHTYDNFLGMLGREPGQKPRGDGFTLGRDGLPTASSPYPDGRIQRAFRMPTTCQLSRQPSQEWKASHDQYADGRMDGWVKSDSGPVSMGYWQREDLPFTYDAATKFPLADRWFSSLLGQTLPNRRFLIAATAAGMTDNLELSGPDLGPDLPDTATLVFPANGTIFDRLTLAGVSWTDYNADFPTGETAELFPLYDAQGLINRKPTDDFFTDVAAGNLPGFSMIDEDFDKLSQENPQNIVIGETYLAKVVNAIGASPLWRKTLLLVMYDEGGGYYDHVPPPPALVPDAIPPIVRQGESTYDGYGRYGFRVPAFIVGPYAKPGYVSHTVYDHTSVLALVERKWNLPAMTYRDANANDLTDMLDLDALAAGKPTFPELPKLHASGETDATRACSKTGPGTIPPPASIGPAPSDKARLVVRYRGKRRREHGVVADVSVSEGFMTGVAVELRRGSDVVARSSAPRLSGDVHRVVLRARKGKKASGRLTLVVLRDGHVLLRRRVRA